MLSAILCAPASLNLVEVLDSFDEQYVGSRLG